MGGVFVVETVSVMLQVDVLQVERRPPHLSNGAAAPSLRAFGLEGDAGRRALLDHHDDAGAGRLVDVEDSMTNEALVLALVLGLGESGSRDGALSGVERLLGARRRYAKRAAAAGGAAQPSCRKPNLSPATSTRRCSTTCSCWRSARDCRRRFRRRRRCVKAAHKRKIEVVGEIELFARELARLKAAARLRAAHRRRHRHQRQDDDQSARGFDDRGRRQASAGGRQHLAGRARRAAHPHGRDDLPEVWVLELSSFQLATTRSLVLRRRGGAEHHRGPSRLARHAGQPTRRRRRASFRAKTGSHPESRRPPSGHRDGEEERQCRHVRRRCADLGDSYGIVVDHGVAWLAWAEDLSAPARQEKT